MGNKKDLNAEIDLVAFISFLSVCICFLLLTAIWIQVGSLDVKQAMGGQSEAETEKIPSIWAEMKDDGALVIRLQDFSSKEAREIGEVSRIEPLDGQPDFEALKIRVEEIQTVVPKFNTALIKPNVKSKYQEVITVMDNFKKIGVGDLGVSPL